MENRYKCLICGNTDRFKALATAQIEIIVDGSGNLIKVDVDQVVNDTELEIQEVTDCMSCGASGPESIKDLSEHPPGEDKDESGSAGNPHQA